MNKTEQNRITRKLYVVAFSVAFLIPALSANPPQPNPFELSSTPKINITDYLSASPVIASRSGKRLYQQELEKYAKLYPENPDYQKIAEEFKTSVENCKNWLKADIFDIWKAEIWLIMRSRELEHIPHSSEAYLRYINELSQHKKDLRLVIEGLRSIEGSRRDIFGKGKAFPQNICRLADESIILLSDIERILEDNAKASLRVFEKLLSEKEERQNEKWSKVIEENLGRYVRPMPKKLQPSSPDPVTATWLNTRLAVGSLSALFWIAVSEAGDLVGIGSDEFHRELQNENWKTIRGNNELAHNNLFFLKKVPHTTDVYNSTLNNWQRTQGVASIWRNAFYSADITAAALALGSPFLVKAGMYYGALGEAGGALPVDKVLMRQSVPAGGITVPVASNVTPVAGSKMPILTKLWGKVKGYEDLSPQNLVQFKVKTIQLQMKLPTLKCGVSYSSNSV